jgi:hypothetical protein
LKRPNRVQFLFAGIPATIIALTQQSSRMARQEQRSPKKKEQLVKMLHGLLDEALDEDRDVILCYETDEDTGKRKVHVMTGSFVSPCMLRKLIGLAESQKDEGSTLFCRAWTRARNT